MKPQPLTEEPKENQLKLRHSTILATLLFVPLLAFAGTVNLQFNGVGSNSFNGVSTYPYYFTVDGQAAKLMCISYNEHIQAGETWQAIEQPITTLQEEQAAFLYEQAETNPGPFNSSINAAAWYLMEGVPAMDAWAAWWLADAQSQTFTAGEFQYLSLYVPIPGTESWRGETPQTFIGSATATPEPSSLLLIGSGVLGIAGFMRRKLA